MKKALLILNSKKFTTYSYFRMKEYRIIYSTDVENKNEQYINELIKDYDLVIIGGGTQHLTKNEIGNYKEIFFLKQIIECCEKRNKLLIGICLGCQLIAQHYGCEIKELEFEQIGYNYLDTSNLNMKEIEKDKFLSDIDYKKLKGAFSFHKDYICFDENDKVNSELTVIAESINDLPYIIKHKNKQIYGFQQHPEHTQETLGRIIKIFQIDEDKNILNEEINVNFFDSFINNL